MQANLTRLFSPRHIAFIGGNDALLAIKRCVGFGFAGDIWPVHPTREQIGDYPCVKNLDDLPEAPDAAFVAVRRDTTVQVVEQLASLGCGGCVCYAAGFAELDEGGAAAQSALVAAAGDMPLVGPNCFGFVNYLDNVALWPYLFAGDPVDSGVALISQSGNIAMNLTMNQRSVPFTHVIGAGNQAVLGVADYVTALLQDDRVKVIALYIEGLDDVNAFATAAMQALEQGVPIVAIKIGRSDLGAQQASTHTSSLVGEDGLYDALFERTGVIRVQSLSALLETVKMFAVCGPLSGRRMTSLSCSGGEAALVADMADRFQLTLPPFTESQRAELKRKLLADYVTVSNPLDYNTAIWGNYEATRDCFRCVMEADSDVSCLIYDYPTIEAREVAEWDVCLDAYIDAHKQTGKAAVVITTISELIPQRLRERMIAGGVAPLQGTENAFVAIAAASWYAQRRSELSANPSLPKAAQETSPHLETKTLDEAASKNLLEKYGVCVPAGAVVSAEQTAEAAQYLGFPVVVKAVGDTLEHKTELSAVALNLKNVEDVESAANKITDALQSHDQFAGRFLVEKMIKGGIAELIIGIKRDDQFGPVVVIGAGGVLVELIEDSRTLLLPAERRDVECAIKSLKSYQLLNGFRGAEKADVDAVVDAVMAVAAFALDHWNDIEALDINPLIVRANGKGAIAADALIKMAANGHNTY